MSEIVTQNHIAGSWNATHDQWTTSDSKFSILRTRKHDSGTMNHGTWSVVRYPGGIVFADESYLECRKKVAELLGAVRPVRG